MNVSGSGPTERRAAAELTVADVAGEEVVVVGAAPPDWRSRRNSVGSGSTRWS